MGPGDSTQLIPDDDAADVLLAHSFWGPLSLTTPTEEAVICLFLDPSGLHLFGQTVGGGEYELFSAAEERNRARRQSGFPTFISCQSQDANVCASDDNRTKVTNSMTSAPSLWWHVGPYFWPSDLTRTANPISRVVFPLPPPPFR